MERGNRRKAAVKAQKQDELARAVAEMRRLERLIEQLEDDLNELRAGSPSVGAGGGVVLYGQVEDARMLTERTAERTERLAARLESLRREHHAVVERINVIQRTIRKIGERDWD